MPRTLRQMCVRPMRLHTIDSGGWCGSKWKISITAPPGMRIQPILQVAPGTSSAEEAAHAILRRVGDADQRAAEHVPPELHRAVEVRDGDAGVAEGARFHRLLPLMWIGRPRSACAAIVSPGLTAADEGKNDASTTNRFVDVVGAAERIEHRRARIGAEHQRAALVRRILRPRRVGERLRRPVAETPQNLAQLARPAARAPACCSGGTSSTMRPSGVERARDCRGPAGPRSSPASRSRATPTRRTPTAGCGASRCPCSPTRRR